MSRIKKDESGMAALRRNFSHPFSSVLILFLIPILAAPAHASPREELKQAEREMKQAEKKQAELAVKKDRLETELLILQQRLVKAAEAAQKAETDLTAAEEKLRVLKRSLKEKEAEMKESRARLDALTGLALRLSRTPPEAMVLMPGDTSKSVKAARALKMASEDMRRQAEAIALQMQELERLKVRMENQRDRLAGQRERLEKTRRSLAENVEQRQKLREALGGEERKQAAALSRLARKARDMAGLVATLDAAEKDKRKDGMRSFAGAKGKARPPAAGSVARGFGGSHKGVTLDARPGGGVVAPFDGEVVFTGPFLTYGKMVILRHGGGFHTLLAGLSRIDVKPGDVLLEGEPVGGMGESPARLYIEVRRDNQPVDPAPWMSLK